MKKILAIIVVVVVSCFIIDKVSAEKKLIPDEAIRLRVVPNSNSVRDQSVKLKVKDELQMSMSALLKDTKGIDEARQVIKNNLDQIDLRIDKVLKAENYNLGYQLDFDYHYFPAKEFKGVTYEEGMYESVYVTLGEGKGDNWWCVLFPPLCLLEAEESDEVEYKFFLQELIDKYL